MSNEPNIEDLRRKIEALTLAVNKLETFATSVSQIQPKREGFGVDVIERACYIIKHHDQPLYRVTVKTNECTTSAEQLYRYRDYEREARYCIEASAHAAALCDAALHFARLTFDEIQKLRDRAKARVRGTWTNNDETRFRRERTRFNSIAGTCSSSPDYPDFGKSSEPWREETQTDRALKVFLELCQKIPAYQRTLIHSLELMADEMAREFDRG